MQAFNNGFYYEEPIPNEQGAFWIIEFGPGISDKFSYSRQLNDREYDNWMHGGKLYDANNNEVGFEGNHPSFWSDPEGLFAVEIPKDLPRSQFTYELYQFINGQFVSDTIVFLLSRKEKTKKGL